MTSSGRITPFPAPDSSAFRFGTDVVPIGVVQATSGSLPPTIDPIDEIFGATVERVVEDAAVREGETRRPIGVLVASDGRRFELSRPVVIGRDPRVDADLPDAHRVRVLRPDVSRRHATVRVDGWTATVEDAGSTNGTLFVSPDGERQVLEPHCPRPLLFGATVSVGSLSFTLQAIR